MLHSRRAAHLIYAARRKKKFFLPFLRLIRCLSHQMLTAAVVLGGEHRRVEVEAEHAAAQCGGAGDHIQGPEGPPGL